MSRTWSSSVAMLGSAVFGAIAGFAAGHRIHLSTDDAVLVELRLHSNLLRQQQAALNALPSRVAPILVGVANSEMHNCLPTTLGQEGAQTTAAPNDTSGATSSPTPENMAAHDQVERILGQAIGRGHWGDADRAELRKQWDQLTQEQADDISTKLSVAINSGRLKVERERGGGSW